MRRQKGIPTIILRQHAIEAMEKFGRPIERCSGVGSKQLFEDPAGETVCLRTHNDRRLVVTTSSTEPNAKLDIEGTNYLLIAMPQSRREHGPTDVYLVPTPVAAQAIRKAHEAWLSTSPNTKGSNTTWKLEFDQTKYDWESNFAAKWLEYRIDT
jgi:hypothetical protein